MRTKLLPTLTITVLLAVPPGFTQQSGDPVSQTANQPTTALAAAATPVPPPSASALRSRADLEKLVAPIALYPDPLLATVLPASVYPLEIVQAARFVADTNNLAKLDDQSWDANVKAVARIPEAIKKLNDDLSWTIQLGEAFLAQDKDLMDAIQSMRGKAQKAGTLQSSPQQIVTVTNAVIERTVEERVVVVTNTVVQIQPSNPQVVYVPSYPPTVYYPPPGYVYDPVAPLVTFGVGMAMGAIIANNCNWHGGGVYIGHHGMVAWGGGNYHGNVNVDIDRTINNNVNRNTTVNPNRATSTTASQQKWQPDQSRLSKSGSPGTTSSARVTEARGWGAGGAGVSSGSVGARPSTGTVGARPSAGNAGGGGASAGAIGARPSTGTPSAGRPSPSPSVSRPSPSPVPSRSAPSASPSVNRSSGVGGGGSAFGGMSSGASSRSYGSRGAASRGGGFGGGGGRGGGGRR